MSVCRSGFRVDPLRLTFLRHSRQLSRSCLTLTTSSTSTTRLIRRSKSHRSHTSRVCQLTQSQFNHVLLEFVNFFNRTTFEVFPNISPSIRFDDDQVSFLEVQGRVLAEEQVFASCFETDDAQGSVGRNSVKRNSSTEIHVALRLSRESSGRCGKGRNRMR